MTQPFYKPKPTSPDASWVVRLLRWSLGISVAGWAAYGLFAFAFADLGVIPANVQSWLVIVGSALIVIGAESNTVPTCISALSKIGTPRIQNLDYVAFAASIGGTLCSVLITFSSRQVELDGTAWRAFALSVGPLLMGVATALDFYGAALELALFSRDYEQAMAQWLREEQEWNEEHGIEPAVDRSAWREATINDARRLASELNGERAGVTAANLQEYMDDLHARVDASESTRGRWVALIQNGG